MLADLDNLMAERGIGAAIVPMHESMHASFRWMTRGARVTRGYAIKKVDQRPILVTYPMERDEAAATGLQVRLAGEYDYDRILAESPNAAVAYGAFFDRILRSADVIGTVAFFGNAPIHLYTGIVEAIEERGWRVYRSNGEDLIQLARKRKDQHELDAIASVGERTEQVVDEVRAALRQWNASSGMTIGDLKEIVRQGIARRGLIEDHETIVSQGRDAAVPHSRGDASARIEAGLPIVLDIFPADRVTGYFFDLTRTFCVGEIPSELRRLHDEVLTAFRSAAAAMRPGSAASSYQALVCDYFEERGHRTTRSHPGTLEGYVHSLGHGVGLDIHERPAFALSPRNGDQIESGDVVTIEPGLYYPDRAMGVRIEDTFAVTDSGVRSLCRGSYSLEP